MAMRFDGMACECTLAEWMEHGPKLVRDSAVTEVWITDRYPVKSVSGVYWNKSETFVTPPGFYLPPMIFTLADSVYETEMKARKALSLACMEWAKEEAEKLPKAPKEPAAKPLDLEGLAQSFWQAYRERSVEEICAEVARGTKQEVARFMALLADESRDHAEAVGMSRKAAGIIEGLLSEA